MRPLPALLALLSVFFVSTSVSSPQTAFLASSKDSLIQPDPYAPLVFNSVNGLLKSWNQVYQPNGRAIVPGIIPIGTLLYHVGSGGQDIEGMNWFALDAEHSYLFSRTAFTLRDGASYSSMYIYAATRPLKVLYFDGFSAAKTGNTLELQDHLLFTDGKNPDGRMAGDISRANGLCNMFEPFGIQGFVREEATFEVIWCDFKDGVKLVHTTNVTDPFFSFSISELENSPQDYSDFNDALPKTSRTDFILEPTTAPPFPPGGGPPGRGPPRGGPSDPFDGQTSWSFAQAASWHHILPEPRISLFPSFYVTLYDEEYKSVWKGNNPSISASKHSLDGLTSEDVDSWKERIFQALREWNPSGRKDGPFEWGSGIDWRGLAQSLSDRTGGRLLEMRELLRSYEDHGNATRVISDVGLAAFSILMPYTDFHFTLNDTVPEAVRREWFSRAEETCSGIFTSYILQIASSLSPWDLKLLRTFRTVSSQICSFSSRTLSSALLSSPNVHKSLVATISDDLRELMSYLKWPSWEKCKESCKDGEICHIPMWPIGGAFPGDKKTEVDLTPQCKSRDDFLRGPQEI